ncbi:MAG TPA: PorV/PorQ family protein [Terriglobales bacterium]|nr:PorV/PorQ family protein [Terriglobales bacterium]
MIRKICLTITLLLITSVSIVQGATGDGGYPGAFSRMGLGARALGMGGAFVAVADDGFASAFNPAGLVQLKKHTFNASYRFMSLDRELSYVSYQQPIKGAAGVGLYWINSGVGNVETRDYEGKVTGELDNNENLVNFNFAKKIIGQFSAGLNIKYTQSKLANIDANTVGFDLGVLFGPYQKLRFGLAVDNIGMKYSWNSGKYWQEFDQLGTDTNDDFPLNFKFGGSYLLLKDKLLLSAQVDKSDMQSARPHFGVEYQGIKYLAGRLGYNDGSFTFGLGINYTVKSITFGLDYAFISSQVGTDADNLVTMGIGF